MISASAPAIRQSLRLLGNRYHSSIVLQVRAELVRPSTVGLGRAKPGSDVTQVTVGRIRVLLPRLLGTSLADQILAGPVGDAPASLALAGLHLR